MFAVGVVGSIADQKKEDKAAKQSYGDKSDLSTLDFEQKNWLEQQSHKWNLEDYARTQNYKEDAIAGFRDYAPANAASATGEWQAPPARTTVDTTGLAATQANGQPLIYDPRTGEPILGNVPAPAKPGTLQQVA